MRRRPPCRVENVNSCYQTAAVRFSVMEPEKIKKQDMGYHRLTHSEFAEILLHELSRRQLLWNPRRKDKQSQCECSFQILFFFLICIVSSNEDFSYIV